MNPGWRLAVDIGGTFTDVVLAGPEQWTTHKLLTTHADPAVAVMNGIAAVLAVTGVPPDQISTVLHGTTLATNALIERKGARTVLLVTEGHRDALEIGLENRFDQYDIFMQRPAPLVPRERRLPVRERLSARGRVLLPLVATEVERVVEEVAGSDSQSIAIGLLHAWADPRHEEVLAEALIRRLPGIPLSLSSEVCPEIREYERLSTTAANAFVKPLMAGYLRSLDAGLKRAGISAPLLIMTSGGGLTSLATACDFPVRLVESGPAGGAMLASALARSMGLARVLAFDMGGTTAKLTLIDDGEPEWSRTFEVARAWKFRKGSGMPVRIPVIELVEIGAGGGSIASVDQLGRVQVGPDSAGSEPGPACYGRGGRLPTVTDADLVLGKLLPQRFAGGSINLHAASAIEAVRDHVAGPLDIDIPEAARGIADTVDENMASAARNHAGEWGRELAGRTLIAFGGAAPLHAAALAERLDICRIIVPRDAGVGSAAGFLLAPIAYEVVRSRHAYLDALEDDDIHSLLAQMRAEALRVVEPLLNTGPVRETVRAWMRYVGQGHEIPVLLEMATASPGAALRTGFASAYANIYGRLIPGQRVELISWTLSLSGAVPALPDFMSAGSSGNTQPGLRDETRHIDQTRDAAQIPIERSAVAADHITGPVLIVEDQTTTVVPAGWQVHADGAGHLILTSGTSRSSS